VEGRIRGKTWECLESGRPGLAKRRGNEENANIERGLLAHPEGKIRSKTESRHRTVTKGKEKDEAIRLKKW